MKRRYNETFSDSQKENYEKYMSNRECEVCKGKRLNPEALAVRVGDKNIFELSSLSVTDSLSFFEKPVNNRNRTKNCSADTQGNKRQTQFHEERRARIFKP